MSGTEVSSPNDEAVRALFEPVHIAGMALKSRLVMAPMTRHQCPGGVPTAVNAAYYRRRAAADIGLIVTEGVWVDHPGASNDENIPRFYGADALAGWRAVVEAVHAQDCRIVPQLWHIGLFYSAPVAGIEREWGRLQPEQVGPSGLAGSIGVMPKKMAEPMTERQIEEVVAAFASAGRAAMELGCDGVALHGGHGYLLDQFLWAQTNQRTDRYGGSVRARSTFCADIVRAIRREAAPDFPILFRFSQWKLQNYAARLAQSPDELAQVLEPLAEAGVDMFDASQRRFWEPEFSGSDLNLAGWAKKLTGKPSITVGSVGLDRDLLESLAGADSRPVSLDRLAARFATGEFDLAAVGRALLADAEWAAKVKAGRLTDIAPFTPAALAGLS